MPAPRPDSAWNAVTKAAAIGEVHRAFQWFHLQEKQICDWQMEVAAIAAPPFGEQNRAQWLQQKFQSCGLSYVHIDAEGNVLGTHQAAPRDAATQAPSKCVLLTAHLDTVFPRDLHVAPRHERERIVGPGINDNASGIAALLALATVLDAAHLSAPADILFVGSVGEEGEGNLRGMRALFANSELSKRIASVIVLDGAGVEVAITQGLGSRRFEITLRGPGGHSWVDAGLPNPIVVLSRIIANFSEIPLPAEPRTTANFGWIAGGTSVNSIPQSAAVRADFRSIDPLELVRLEVLLFRAVEDAVLAAGSSSGRISYEIRSIGERPAASLPLDSYLARALAAVDRHLRLKTQLSIASTDANLPLAFGIPAVGMGAGGTGGNAHTLDEWFDPRGRELALRRILLLVLVMAHAAADEGPQG